MSPAQIAALEAQAWARYCAATDAGDTLARIEWLGITLACADEYDRVSGL